MRRNLATSIQIMTSEFDFGYCRDDKEKRPPLAPTESLNAYAANPQAEINAGVCGYPLLGE